MRILGLDVVKILAQRQVSYGAVLCEPYQKGDQVGVKAWETSIYYETLGTQHGGQHH